MPDKSSIPLSKISLLREYIDKLTGSDFFVASQEGLPIEVSKNIDPDKAEASAALADDILITSNNILKNIYPGKTLRTINLEIDNEKSLLVTKRDETTFIIQGKTSLLHILSEIIEQYIEGYKIQCPYCSHDLLLETYKCPSCGSIIPFTAKICPHCKTNVYIKNCPKCGNRITSDGRKVIEEEKISQKPLLLTNTIMGSIMGGLLGYAITQNPLGIIIGAVAGTAGLYLISRQLLKTKIIKIT